MVNTFLPFVDFIETAACLDYRRLGKQRVEARQIINTLENPDAKGWRNHPAVRMWQGYVPVLKVYFNTMVMEWVSRGYKNTLPLYDLEGEILEEPWWLGNEDFHRSHQASLVRKDGEYYEGMFEDLDEEYLDKGYVWPRIVEGKRVMEFSGKQR